MSNPLTPAPLTTRLSDRPIVQQSNPLFTRPPIRQSIYSVFSRVHAVALWSEIYKNRDINTGPLARPSAPLTHLLAPDYLVRSRAPLRSLAGLLAHFAPSLARETVND